jgi:hypothetical protein
MELASIDDTREWEERFHSEFDARWGEEVKEVKDVEEVKERPGTLIDEIVVEGGLN